MLFLYLLLLLTPFAQSSLAAPKGMEVYFIPFDVETYAPVTAMNITTKAHLHYKKVPTETERAVRKELSDGPIVTTFNEVKVRAKIIAPDLSCLIDSDGVSLCGKLRTQTNKVKLAQLFKSLTKK